MQKRWDCLIIVTGLPATGKSRFAEALARTLGLPLLAKDAIKEPLLDRLHPVDAAGSRRLSDLSFALLFLLAPQLPGRGLILEGNFRRGEHEPQLAALLASAASSAQVLCTLDERQRLARLVARGADPARHRGHRDADAAVPAAGAVMDQYLDLPGERLQLAGDAPDSATDALILELAHALRRRERGS
jgi:predicted kinase